MGIFGFFKKKPIEQKNITSKNVTLPHFGQIDINNLDHYYAVNFEFNNNSVSSDLNFENKTIDKIAIDRIESILNNINDFDKKNKIYIEKDFNDEVEETSEYINFYLDEFTEDELENNINLKDQDIPKNIQLLKKLRLIRIGLYPDAKYGTFAVFDYSIDIDGQPCDQLLVINTDAIGNLITIAWES